jgi:DNA-binding NtrC family response regulator
VADATAPLLITGETGVGKERLARAIHAEISRSERPFVAVNCAALPEQLLESELFGQEKGSFTGADARRTGRFEQAAGGTIFLDEIGEMPTHLQVKLLNVLQRGEVQRIGAAAPLRVDARVMAATNRDVTSEVEAGTFREDLYYRLNVVPLEIPALRERREDIPDLVGSLIQALHQDSPDSAVEGIAEDALEALMAYAWPGNVRELINVIERGMLLARGPRIELADLPEQIAGRAAAALPGSSGSAASAAPAPELPPGWRDLGSKKVRQWAIDRVERAYLTAVLTETSGVVAETARRAGISPRALYDRMRRHELDKDDFKH